MRQVNERPKSGSYLEIWEHNGIPFAETYSHRPEGLRVFNHYIDEDNWIDPKYLEDNTTQSPKELKWYVID